MAMKDPPLTSPAPGGPTIKPLGAAKPATPPADKQGKEAAKDREKDQEKGKPSPKPPATAKDARLAARLTSVDAYRGLVMLLMASAGFGIPAVAASFPEDSWWHPVAHQFKHVAWQGCAIWDLIQPSFMFLVGVALPFSFASRRAQGHSYFGTLGHAAVRCVILVLLAILLSSQLPHTQTEFVFINVLAQIGLGYLFVFLLVNRGLILQTLALVAVLGGYGYWFYQHPLPGPDYDYAAVGALPEDLLPGEQGHWSKNTNVAAEVDRKFLNLFPRKEPFRFNKEGYCTLNFIPSIATMLLGLMAGELLRGAQTQRRKVLWLLLGGAVCLAAGLGLGLTIVPIVKKIWTPSWALMSGAAALWLLAVMYWVIDVRGFRRWAYPLVVVGANSILMYLMSQLMSGWIFTNLKITFGSAVFEGTYGPIVHQVAVLAVLWVICFWLYRQRAFIKI
jgi:predicted acyltransferase